MSESSHLMSNDNFIITQNGLVIRKDPTLEAWLAIGEDFKLYHHAISWLVGDWILHGENREWGEMYSQALDATEFSMSTLRNYKHVCKRFPFDKRIASLSFSHHAEVAPCDDQDADLWLSKAVENGWSVGQLRRAMNGEDEAEVNDQPVASKKSKVDRLRREFLRLELEEKKEFLDWANREFQEEEQREGSSEKKGKTQKI